MKQSLLLCLLLSGCSTYELREQQQDAELELNALEVQYAHREICQQIRAATLYTTYNEMLIEWHSYCGYD